MTLTAKEFSRLFPKITEHINSEEVSALIEKLKYVPISKNKSIIKDNQKNDTLYFVIVGRLDCYIEKDGNKISIGKIFPGEYVGEVSMLDNKNATSSVITETPCIFYTLNKASFNELEKEHPVISGKILRSISSLLINRLISTDKLLFDGLTEHEEPNLHHEQRKIDLARDWFVKLYHQLHH